MSKKNLKNLIRTQAEESVDRIQDGYSWRNALFEEEKSDKVLDTTVNASIASVVVNKTPDLLLNTPTNNITQQTVVNQSSDGVNLTTPYSDEKRSLHVPFDLREGHNQAIVDIELKSNEILEAPGVKFTPIKVNNTTIVIPNTPLSTLTAHSAADITADTVNLTTQNSDHKRSSLVSDDIEAGQNQGMEDVKLTSPYVLETSSVVNLTPADVKYIPNDSNLPQLRKEILNTNFEKDHVLQQQTKPSNLISSIGTQQDGVNKTPFGVDYLLNENPVTDSNLPNKDLKSSANEINNKKGKSILLETPTIVPLPSKIYPETDQKSNVGDNRTPKNKLNKSKKPLLGNTNDLYLVGLWYVLKTIFKDGYGNYTLRELARRLQVDHSNLLRSLNRAENAGLIRRFPTSDGTYIEIMTDLALFPSEKQEGNLESFFTRFNDPNFQKNFQLKENLFAIFWSILAAQKQPEELSGSTFEILISLALKRDDNYVAAFNVKYLPRVKSNPAIFFKTILEKESDPLSKTEIAYGKEIIATAKNLISANPESIGLTTMRTMGKRFYLDLGASIEECKQILQDVKDRFKNLINNFT
jgi:hypothetical protein